MIEKGSDKMSYEMQIKEAAAYIKTRYAGQIDVGMVLGSGLGVMADYVEDAIVIENCDIPHFPVSAVVGHSSQIVIGKLNNKVVMVLKGRVHFYEGKTMQEITLPIRVMQELNVKQLILTNACGGVNETFIPGTLMMIEDHINLMGTSPLIGANLEAYGTRFPDMSYTYSKRLIKLALDFKDNLKTPLRQGVYAGWMGPAYETPAEIRMARVLGADAIGMSTVPEALVASHNKMEIVGISCITNMACGILDQPLDHNEVVETADRVRTDFVKLVRYILENM